MKMKAVHSSALAVLLVQAATLVWGQQQGALPVTTELSVDTRLVPAAVLEGVRPMRVGDKWVYRFNDLGNKKAPIEQMSQVVHVQGENTWMYWTNPARQPGTQEGIQRWDQLRGASMEGFELNPARPLAVGRRLWNAQPLDDWFQFPLTDGKTYKVRRDWGNGEGYTEYTAKVGSLVRVQVGAGMFNAREVVFKGWWYRTTGNTSSGRAEVIEYWSPDMARVIKSSFRDWTSTSSLWNYSTWELVRWEPQAELVFKPARQAQ